MSNLSHISLFYINNLMKKKKKITNRNVYHGFWSKLTMFQLGWLVLKNLLFSKKFFIPVSSHCALDTEGSCSVGLRLLVYFKTFSSKRHLNKISVFPIFSLPLPILVFISMSFKLVRDHFHKCRSSLQLLKSGVSVSFPPFRHVEQRDLCIYKYFPTLHVMK